MRFYRQKEGVLGKKAGWLLQSHFPLGERRVCQADELTSASDRKPDWSFLGEPNLGLVTPGPFGPIVLF